MFPLKSVVLSSIFACLSYAFSANSSKTFIFPRKMACPRGVSGPCLGSGPSWGPFLPLQKCRQYRGFCIWALSGPSSPDPSHAVSSSASFLTSWVVSWGSSEPSWSPLGPLASPPGASLGPLWGSLGLPRASWVVSWGFSGHPLGFPGHPGSAPGGSLDLPRAS